MQEEPRYTGNSSSSGYQQQREAYLRTPQTWLPPPSHPPPEGTPKVPPPTAAQRYWASSWQDPATHTTQQGVDSALYPKQTEPLKPKPAMTPHFRAYQEEASLEHPWEEAPVEPTQQDETIEPVQQEETPLVPAQQAEPPQQPPSVRSQDPPM